MLSKPRYITSSVSIVFPLQTNIRRKAYELEDAIGTLFFPPQVLPIPDEVSPEAPRIVFKSKHGFGQLLVTQLNIQLLVNYSPDWQVDASKREGYLKERIDRMFGLIDSVIKVEPHFCGITTRINILSEAEDSRLIDLLSEMLLKEAVDPTTFDLSLKQTKVIQDSYFSNLTVENYRGYKVGEANEVSRFPLPLAIERGIAITGDINDRYSFNERDNYVTNRKTAQTLLTYGMEELQQLVEKVGE